MVNVRKESGLVDPETGHFVEVDVFLPSLNLAFEFQERHHYIVSECVMKPLAEIQKRDALKKELAQQQGITLITVPCWWDGRPDR